MYQISGAGYPWVGSLYFPAILGPSGGGLRWGLDEAWDLDWMSTGWGLVEIWVKLGCGMGQRIFPFSFFSFCPPCAIKALGNLCVPLDGWALAGARMGLLCWIKDLPGQTILLLHKGGYQEFCVH